MMPTTRNPPVILTEQDEIQPPQPANMGNDEMKEFVKDLRKISNSKQTKTIVQDVELDRKRKKFISRIESTLNNFKKLPFSEDEEQLHKLFIFVLQSCSDTIGPIDDKDNHNLVVGLLKEYAKDDEKLTRSIIRYVSKDIKPMTMYRKYKNGFIKTALFFVSWMYRVIK